MTSVLSTLNTTTEVPLSNAPNPQLLPGHRSIGCPLLRVCVHGVCVCVCVHLDGLNAEPGCWATCHFTLLLSTFNSHGPTVTQKTCDHTNAYFTGSHHWIGPSLQGLWNIMFCSHSKICLYDINAYLLNADSKRESIIMFAFLLLKI